MNVLVFNCGSSSLKYKLLDMPSDTELSGGEAQRSGPPTAEPARSVYRTRGEENTRHIDMADHAAAFDQVMGILSADPSLMPEAFGHRLVHGAGRFPDNALIGESAIADLEATQDLAPLHNPPAINLLKACRGRYPTLPQVAVFDTAFHSSIPSYARTYALPKSLREDLGLHKYGFHGTSHRYVAEEAARFLGRPLNRLNAVSCHLGSGGASLCAIVNGRSVDNTFGFSPLQGLMMSTRCGDLDPALLLQLVARTDGDARSVEAMLNKRSGVLGMSGTSADIRDVLSAASGDGYAPSRMSLTVQTYLWRIRKYLGAYLTVVDSTDAVIFTDTIGESVPMVRWAVCTNMEAFGLVIDPERNAAATALPADVAAEKSPVRILAIQTNEELAIARETYAMLAHAA